MTEFWSTVLLFVALCIPNSWATLNNEAFNEHVSFRSLRDGRVATKFAFTTTIKASPRNPETLHLEDVPQHYTLFPLSLGQILREYGVTELHLTLNAGKWNYESWGYPEDRSVGTGGELWAWMADGAQKSVDKRWQGLRNALSGLFCASLGSMDDQRTTAPYLSFSPEGSLPQWNHPHHIRHATLPSEHVCTENLTPFLKLLPCKSLSGIASLLNPHKLFDADWHGMGLHVSWHPESGVELRLTFQTVSDPMRDKKVRDWSLQSLFERSIERACPVASQSTALVVLPADEAYRVMPEPTLARSGVAVFDIPRLIVSEPLNIGLAWQRHFEYPLELPQLSRPSIEVQRVLNGPSQARGTLSVSVRNKSPAQLQVVYLETMPWFVQLYLHTLRITVDGVQSNELMSNLSYIPPIPHGRPATLQSVLTLPAESTLDLSIDVTKAFLRYTEHPPDAQRGWDLPPAVFVPLDSAQNSSTKSRLLFSDRVYSSTLLVDLATPDFSMPYNVIILTCSIVAFVFGNSFNLLTRSFITVDLRDKEKKEEKENVENR